MAAHPRIAGLRPAPCSAACCTRPRLAGRQTAAWQRAILHLPPHSVLYPRPHICRASSALSLQISSPADLASQLLFPVVRAATGCPWLAAALASGSVPGSMLQTAQQLAEQGSINLVSAAALQDLVQHAACSVQSGSCLDPLRCTLQYKRGSRRMRMAPDASRVASNGHGTRPSLSTSSATRVQLFRCPQAIRAVDGWKATVSALIEAVPGDSDSAAGMGMPQSVLTELQAAKAALNKQQQLLLTFGAGTSHGPGNAMVAESSSELRQILQPAAQLGSLLSEWMHSPPKDAERRLKLVRAAAARSCAYLCCANVAQQGGPAAGQGVGSMRCR